MYVFYLTSNYNALTKVDFSIALNRVSLAQELEDDQEAVLFGLGTVTLGGIPANDSVPVTGKNITVPNVLFKEKVDGKNVSVPAYYTVPIDSWDFAGSEEIDTATPLAILDSGTTLLYAPDNVAAAFNGEIVPQGYYNETAGAYLIDCNATIPELAVTIAGTQFFFTREDLVYAYDLTGDVCLSSVVPGGNSTSDVYILWVYENSNRQTGSGADNLGATDSSSTSWRLSISKATRFRSMSVSHISQDADRTITDISYPQYNACLCQSSRRAYK